LEGIAAPPVADGSRCFVISPKGTLAAFRSSDGEPLWRTEAPMGFRARNGPILASDGLIAVSQDDGRLLALDPQDGTIRWTGKPAARSDGPISVGASAVLLGNCDAAVRFHATGTGELVGAVPLGDDAQVAGAVAVRGTRAVCGTRTGDVVMLDTAAQTVLWRAPTDGGEVFSAPVLTDDLVVVTTMAAEAIAFAAADGRELWRYRSEIRSATSPILVDGRVVLATAGIVVALDASGAVLWRISVGDATTEPCAGAGLIVVGTAEGDIVAVGPRD
jgi:outer membrane protein assembly factor BamB